MKIPWLLALWLLPGWLMAQVIPEYTSNLFYSTDVDYVNEVPLNIYNNSVVNDGIGLFGGVETPLLIRDTRNGRVDGFHKAGTDQRYFSFDNDVSLGGNPVLKSDIILCDVVACSTFSKVLDAASEGLSHVNVNAFTLDPETGDVLFSIDAAAQIDGVDVLPADVMRYDGAGFSFFYDSLFSINALGPQKNIDALVVLPNDIMLVSFASDGSHLGIDYRDSYLLQLHLPSSAWDLAYTPLLFGDDYSQVNIISLHAIDNDVIFEDGFE